MNGTWYHLPILHGLWLLPVFCALFAYAAWKRHLALQAFTGTVLLDKLTATYSRKKRLLKHLLFLLAVLFLILAMARPAWNPVPQTVRREGRDVIFLLDVSRSMLADDLKPNRLERAKLAIDDCIEVLQGDRVALAVFAGNTVVRCPLTQDYGFFRMMLADVSTDTVSRGGTLIGDALRKVARDIFDQQDRQYKDIVLITDGEDHESFPLEAAKAIGEAGIRLIAVGLGDETGTPIVITDESGRRDVLKYKGEVVRSRLDSDALRAMVNATPGGRYLPVATGNIELDKVYQNLIATAEKREIESQTLERFEEKFQIFLALCLICLALESVLSERKSLRKLAAVLLLGLCSLSGASQAGRLLKSGNQALAAGNHEEALSNYQQAAIEEPESPYLYFNQGLVYFQQQDYAKATELFQQAADKAKDINPPDMELAARAKLALGNAFFKECKRQQDSNLKKSVEACEKSIVNYQDALHMNAKLAPAEKNLQVARLTLKKILNDLKEQLKEQQKQQQQAREQAEKLEQLAQQQQKASEQSGKADKDGDRSVQTQQKLLQKQQQISEETRKLAEERPQQQDPVRQKMDEAAEQQKQAEEALDQQQFKEASEKQKEAAKLLKEAREQMQKQQEQQQQQGGQQENQEQKKEDASENQDQQAQETPKDSREQQEKEQEAFNLSESASDILNEERKNQRQRQLQRPAETRPVDKDW